MTYRWIYNSYSSSSNQERRSIWFNPAVTNTTNYSLSIYYSNPNMTTTHYHHTFFIIVPVTVTATFVYYYYVHRRKCNGRYYYNYSTLSHSIQHCTRRGGGSWWWWEGGMEWSACGETTTSPSPSLNNIDHATIDVPQSIWFNPAVTNTNHSLFILSIPATKKTTLFIAPDIHNTESDMTS